MIERLIFSGFGGQGLITAGKLLVACAMSEGKHVTYFPSYGSAVRGGTANCQMVVSDEPILSPVVERATVLLMMNGPSMQKFLPRLEPGGLMVLNTSMVEAPQADGVRVLGVRATEIAQEIGTVQVANVVMLSALNQITRMVEFKTLHEGLVTALKGRREALIPANEKAIEAGRRAADVWKPT